MAIDGQNITFVTGSTGITFTVASGISSGTTIHGNLTDRDTEDQHPISAITDLQVELDEKAIESDFDRVDNTSDSEKEVSVLVQVELDLKKNSSEVDNVDNIRDIDKVISTLTQEALDLKAPLSRITNVDNIADADKVISDLTQDALDLKVDKSGYFNYFNNDGTSAFTVVSVEPAYEEVDRLTMTGLEAGTYVVTISGRVQCDTLGRVAFIRWSLDGGATWEMPAVYNVLDVTDKKPFTHIEIIGISAGDTTLIVQAAKDTSVGSMIVNVLDISCERKA